MSNFTFEELETDIIIIAHSLRKQYNNKFETEELVNEVWISGKYLNMKEKGLARQRAKWDMMEYIRRQVGRDIWKDYTRISRPKFLTNFTHKKTLHGYLNEDNIFAEDIFERMPNREHGVNNIDNKDLLNYLYSFLTKKDMEAISYCYMDELTMVEASKLIGIGSSAMSLRIKKVLKTCNEVVCGLELNDVI